LSAYGISIDTDIEQYIYRPYITKLEGLKDYGQLQYRIRGNGLKLLMKKISQDISARLQLFSGNLIKSESNINGRNE